MAGAVRTIRAGQSERLVGIVLNRLVGMTLLGMHNLGEACSCGPNYPFSLFVNDEFVVHAHADRIYPSGPLSTDLCTRTSLVENAQEDLEVLGNPFPIPLDGSSWGAIKALFERTEER